MLNLNNFNCSFHTNGYKILISKFAPIIGDLNKEKEKRHPIVFHQKKKKKEKQFFNKTQYSYLLAYLHTRVCLYVLTFHPKVAFHIRLILSSVVLSSKIKFAPLYEIEGKIGRKKNGLPNETISYFAPLSFVSERVEENSDFHLLSVCLVVILFTELLCHHDGPLNIRTFVGNGKGWKFRGLPFERAIRSGRNTPLLYSSIKSGKNWSFVSLGVFLGGSFCQEILRGNSYTSWIWFRELKRIEYFWKENHEGLFEFIFVWIHRNVIAHCGMNFVEYFDDEWSS